MNQPEPERVRSHALDMLAKGRPLCLSDAGWPEERSFVEALAQIARTVIEKAHSAAPLPA
jgi:hypothetical protein